MQGRHELFYVFYDKHDFVSCFGTPKQLVNDGLFKTVNEVYQKAAKIKSGTVKGFVVTLPFYKVRLKLNDA